MRKSLPLSVAVITLNEEKNLARCLESIREMAQEIVVIDSGSTDATAQIAEKFGAKFEFQKWPGHVAQKNIALQRCSQPWVLALDADEVVSPELAQSIRELLSAECRETGFSINRRTQYLGEWIWHSWYPEWRLRLVRRSQAQWTGRDPHDKLEVQGETGTLKGDLLHFSYPTLQDHLQRTMRYAQISARELHEAGQRARWYHFIFSPPSTFLKKILLRHGWRDGWRGWIIAFATCFGVFAKYAFLLEMQISPKTSAVKSIEREAPLTGSINSR